MDSAFELMKARHSVRKYSDRPVETEKAELLKKEIDEINAVSGLKFVLCLNNDDVFKANQPHYGSFIGCRNFFVLCGGKNDGEKIGYYGERLVLFAQSLGLNTCWCALTFERKKVTVDIPDGMKLQYVIALGYGFSQGHEHISKPMEKLCKIDGNTPEWFIRGMEAAMLAPTAINQQKFYFEMKGDRGVKAKALLGPCSKTDLGIVKYHFELGAGKENFEWVE